MVPNFTNRELLYGIVIRCEIGSSPPDASVEGRVRGMMEEGEYGVNQSSAAFTLAWAAFVSLAILSNSSATVGIS